MSTFDIAIIVMYFLVMLAIGFYFSRKQNDMEDFYLGGKGIGVFSTMSLWLSAWIGGAAIIGTADNAYTMGITAVWYIGSMCFGFATFGIFFTPIIKEAGDKFEHITYSDLIEDRYDSKCRIISIITTILANIAYNAGQLVAAGSLISMFTGWDFTLCIIIAAAVVTIYTSTGGLLAVTYTDVLQTILIVLSVVIAVPFMFRLTTGAGLTLKSQLPNTYFNLFEWGVPTILGFIITITLTFFTSMDSYTRSFSAKDVKTAQKGTLLAIVGAVIITLVVTYLGMAGKVLYPDMASSDSVIYKIILDVLPNGFKGIMLIGLMSALMSTSSISILSSSANVTRDIYQRYLKPNSSDKELMAVSIISSIMIGVFSTVLAIKMEDIVNILYIAFTINSVGLFLPTISIFYWKKANSKSAFWSMAISLVVVLVWFFGEMLTSIAIFKVDPVWPGLLVAVFFFISLSLKHESSLEDMEKANKYYIER